MHIAQGKAAVDDGPQAGALHEVEQVVKLAQVAQAGAEDLQLAHEQAALGRHRAGRPWWRRR